MTTEYQDTAQPVDNHFFVQPEVSWLLCTHVANDQLRVAIQSCLEQTFVNFELLVVANGTDAKEIAAHVRNWYGGDARIRLLTTEIKHLTFSLSLGLHHSRAPLVARMDGDDICTPDRLERQVAFMRANPDVVVLGSAYELIDAKGTPLKTVSLPCADSDIRRALLRGNPLCHPSVMFRRAPVVAVGGYLGGVYAQDYDLWTRLAVDSTNRFGNLSEVCLGYRVAGIGTARKARGAYAAVAASQFRNFVMGEGLVWGGAALLSAMKWSFRKFSG